MKKFLSFREYLLEAENAEDILDDEDDLPGEAPTPESGKEKKPEAEPEEEEEEEDKEYGCAMIEFDFPDFEKIQDQIADDDVYREDGKGKVNDPHVTLLYGILDTVDGNEVVDKLSTLKFTDITLGKLGKFENDEYDVIFLEASAPFLSKGNTEAKKFDHDEIFKTYHPHVTISYLKKGKAKEYLEKIEAEEEYTVTPTKLTFSFPDTKKIEKKIEVTDEEAETEEAPKKPAKIKSKEEFEKDKKETPKMPEDTEDLEEPSDDIEL
jgi:2'-5' RNA ligase